MLQNNIFPGYGEVKNRVRAIHEIIALGLSASPVIGASILAAVIGAFWWLLAARFATPDQAGHFVAASGISTLIAEAGNLGISYVLIRYFASPGVSGPSLARTGLAFVTCAVMVGVGLLAAFTFFVINLISLPSDGLTFMLLLLAALGLSWDAIADALLLALGRRWTLFVWSTSASIGRVALLGICVYCGSLQWFFLLACFATPSLVGAIIVFVIVRGALFDYVEKSVFLSKAQVSVFAQYAWQSYLGNVITAIIINILPLIVIRQTGTVAGAKFGVMWLIANLMMLVPAAISLTGFSRGARGEGHINQITRHSTWFLLIIQIPIITGVLVLAPLIFQHLGETYADIEVVQLAPLLLGVLCVGFISQIYSRARLLDGGLRVVILGQSLQTLVVLAFIFLLTPMLGMFGTCLAWFFGSAVTLLFVRCIEKSYLASIPGLVTNSALDS